MVTGEGDQIHVGVIMYKRIKSLCIFSLKFLWEVFSAIQFNRIFYRTTLNQAIEIKTKRKTENSF